MSSSVNAAAPDVFTKDSNSTLRSAALNLDMQALQATAPGFRVTNGVFSQNAAMEPTQLAKPARKEFPETC